MKVKDIGVHATYIHSLIDSFRQTQDSWIVGLCTTMEMLTHIGGIFLAVSPYFSRCLRYNGDRTGRRCGIRHGSPNVCIVTSHTTLRHLR